MKIAETPTLRITARLMLLAGPPVYRLAVAFGVALVGRMGIIIKSWLVGIALARNDAFSSGRRCRLTTFKKQ